MSSADPMIEPDDAWKAEVRERVQKDLDSLAQEAFRDRELGLKNAESDLERKLVQEAFDDSIAHLRLIREETIEAEIQRERERMRTEGAPPPAHVAHGSLQSSSHRRGISYSERHAAQNYHSPRPSSHRPESRSSVDHKIWTPSISPEQDYYLEQQRRLGRPRANSTASRSSTPYQPFARSLQSNGRTVSASTTAKASSSGRAAPPPSTVPLPRARTASMSSSAVSSSATNANANPSFTVINEDEYDVFAFDEFDGDYPGRPASRRPSHVRPDAAEARAAGEGTAPMRIPIVRPEARAAAHMARRAATADIASGSPTAVSLASTAASASQPRSSSYLYVRTTTPHAPRSDDAAHDAGSSGSDPDAADRVTVESEDLSEEEDELKNMRRRLEVARMKESVALGEFQRAMDTYHSAKQAREAIEREVQGVEERRVSKMKRMYREILRMPGKGKARSSSRSGWGVGS
ncbi:hypothetical protein HDZ31DRAFT_66751 [Schizophyllum fasciatum]